MAVSAASLTAVEFTVSVRRGSSSRGSISRCCPLRSTQRPGADPGALLASLRPFVLVNPGAPTTWRPAAIAGHDQDVHQQLEAPPLLYPSSRCLDRKGPLMVSWIARRS